MVCASAVVAAMNTKIIICLSPPDALTVVNSVCGRFAIKTPLKS
jgi:hypothetical protein